MTLTSEINRVQYSGDGSTTAFPITFVYWLDADIQVILTDANGTETIWVFGTHYTLTGGAGATGTLTVKTTPSDYTPASGETLTISSNLDDTQDTSLPGGGAFPSSSVEQQLDKIVRLIQQKAEALGRAIKLSISSTYTDLEIPDPSASKLLRWNSAATALENVDISSLGAIADPVPVANGGTGAITADAARASLLVAGPNLIINGDFAINQRAAASYNATGYGLDRWYSGAAANATMSQQTHTVGQTDVPGAEFYHRVVWGSSPSSNWGQKIENVKQFNSRDVTISFYAKADAAVTLNILMQSFFGSGGSTAVNAASQNLSITTAWAKHTLTFAIASMTGKTIGAGNYLYAVFNSSNMANRTLEISDVQLELGDSATPFAREDFGVTLAKCQRYYQKSFLIDTTPAQAAGQANAIAYITPNAGVAAGGPYINFRTEMRATPTLVFYNPTNSNGNWYNGAKAADSGLASAQNFGPKGFLARNPQISTDAVAERCVVNFTAAAEL